MQSMACMYSPYTESIDRAITPMISGIRIGDAGGYYDYQPMHSVGGSGGRMPDVVDIKMDTDAMMYGAGGQAVAVPGGGGYCSPGHNASIDSSPSSSTQSNCGGGGGGGRSRKNKEDKICGVCGDKALGFNFDAISCESCKAFFRRNAPKGLGYFKCPYDEKCKMDLSNRRFCKRCRLKKCFEIGMRKEYILTEEEKALKRQKIEENRYLKKMCVVQAKSGSPRSE